MKRLLCALALGIVTAGAAGAAADDDSDRKPPSRADVIARAQVWTRTNVAATNIARGPRRSDGFAPLATVECDYLDKELSGNSPKFACQAGEDELKVKIGGTNGEVYAEVLSSRLLWALGFGADAMYPVKVLCKGCPDDLGGLRQLDGRFRFDPASIERKLDAPEVELDDKEGWSWTELDTIAPGGAPRAHRDGLKLLAVFMQHTDSKMQQQRIVCLDHVTLAGQRIGSTPRKAANDAAEKGDCRKPFLMISDVGLTFGRPTSSNANLKSSVNLQDWSRIPVWKDDSRCVGNLPKSLTGTLEDPVISEEGRRFLAGLLMQLSDRQIAELFDTARVSLRPRLPESGRSGFPETSEWVNAFKAKRAQIVERKCS